MGDGAGLEYEWHEWANGTNLRTETTNLARMITKESKFLLHPRFNDLGGVRGSGYSYFVRNLSRQLVLRAR
jgi:hypothetical protein